MAAERPRLAVRAGAAPAVLALAAVLLAPWGASGAEERSGAVGPAVERARELASRGEGEAALEALLAEASAHLRQGEGAAAVLLVEAAREIAPDSPAVHGLLGRARLALQQFPQAAESLERARRLGDGSLRTALYLAAARWENGDLAGGEELYRAAVANTGGAAFPLHQLGRLLLWQGRHADAIGPLQRAVELTPDLDVRLDLARALDRAGRHEEAVAAYRSVVTAEPEHPRAHYGLARALGRLGRNEAVAHHLAIHERLYREEQQRTREAGLIAVELAEARAEIAAGEAASALARLARLPDEPDVLAARAAAHRHAGDLAAAVTALESAVARAPEREDLRMLLREARLAGLEPR